MPVNDQVREAIGRIEPLPFSDGPNFYTVDVDGWGLSAPTKRQLAKMLWDWFNAEDRSMAASNQGGQHDPLYL